MLPIFVPISISVINLRISTARHGLNGSTQMGQDSNNDEITNDTRMLANGLVEQAQGSLGASGSASQAAQQQLATPSASSVLPAGWRPPMNATSLMGPGIPLNSFGIALDDDEDDDDDADDKKSKKRGGKKNKKNKKKNKEKVPMGPFPVVSPGLFVFLKKRQKAKLYRATLFL